MEIWKDIPGFEGKYQASTEGRIKSVARIVIQKNRTQNWPERILKGSKSREYPSHKLYNGVRHFNISAHILVARTFLPKVEGKCLINHKNGIKGDNRLENLEWCTHSENVKHAYDTGLTKPRKGEQSTSSVLTELDVIMIRLYKELGWSYKKLAKMYNVVPSNIASIVKRQTWKHVKETKYNNRPTGCPTVSVGSCCTII